MNTTEFQKSIMAEIAECKSLLAEIKSGMGNSSSSSTKGKEKKARKPRDPNAAPNPWIVFTGKVRAALKSANKPAGKECQQFASWLKTEFKEDAYTMEDSEILAAHADWTPPPPKPKEDKAESAEEAEPKPKPKRVMSDEQKAKMAAGRKLAAEKRKAAAAEAQAAAESADEAEAEAAPSPAPAPKPALSLKPFPYKKQKMLLDSDRKGVWLRNEDGSQGAWQGIFDMASKTINSEAKDYTA